MAHAGADNVDRRDGLRRRIYLACLLVGIPILLTVWLTHRADDPFLAVAYPLSAASQVVVVVGLLRRTMGVRTAERVVLAGIVVTYLGGLGFGVVTAPDLAALDEQVTLSALLTVNLMPMLAYVTFDTARALQVSLAIVGAYIAIIGIRLVPEAVSGRLGGDATDYLSQMIFLLAGVGLLHVIAQVKSQAAEARLTAEAMEALANTDALTGIANRRQLHHVLEEWVGAASPDTNLAVVLLDLDHFKQINDSHGHDIGDGVLRRVARILQDVARPGDLVGRWGGEEFLVIAPATTRDDAIGLAEACRVALSAATSPTVGRITASFGVAVHHDEDTAWTLLRRADDALYTAKASGRDRVEASDAGGRELTPSRVA